MENHESENSSAKEITMDGCVPECIEAHKYCVSFAPSNATCVCKPGYRAQTTIQSSDQTTVSCEQQACYQGYAPYTYVSSVEYQGVALPPDTQHLRPYCCPNGDYLTSACCGIAPQKAAFSFSKRIIGGNDIAGDGIFPWIVIDSFYDAFAIGLGSQFDL
jgi:hypothetical protein